MWIALGVIAGLVVVGFIALRVLWAADDAKSEKEKWVAFRKWGWERSLEPPVEAALLAGLKAVNAAGRSMFISHQSNVLNVDGPPMLVSMYLLGDRFRALGAGASQDPAGAVRALLEAFAAREEPGVLHLREHWFDAGEVDGLNADKFTELAYEVLKAGSSAGLGGIDGSGCDEGAGKMDLRVLGPTPPEVAQLEAAGRFEDAQGARSAYTNALFIDLARLLAAYRHARATQPALAPKAVVRQLLVQMVAGDAPGTMWSQGACSPAHRAIALACVEGQAYAAAA